ncbi:glycosyltransferase, partial [Gammaproteobacteria bacterium]|nr:glycosyltransferase [Gammaproteobacteria bacterium]
MSIMSVQASIIMPCFNSEKYIEEAISSVLMQTFEELELLICDDGSSDKSYEIIKRFAQEDNRIKFFRN